MEQRAQSLRDIIEKNERSRAEKRGSVFMTFIIIMIFAIGGVFYLKTAKPDIYNRAVKCIKNIGYKTVQTVKESFSESEGEQAVPKGEMLLSADNLTFSYLSEGLVQKFKTDSFYCMPLKNATVTSGFGSRTDPVTNKKSAGHHGIDLAAKKGSLIYAYDSGTVLDAGTNEIYGNYVLLQHAGFESFYGHLSESSVKKGDTVKAGQSIGVIGSTGKSTGIHLHFEIRKEGERVDPAPYLYEKI